MSNDLWATPPEVIDFIQREFGQIQLDLCASDAGHVCSAWIDQDMDFLKDCWMSPDFLVLSKGSLTWLNPPYSNPLPFIKQAIKWSKAGYAVVGILNNDSSTKWFVELQEHAAILMPIVGGRISFLNGDGQPIKGNNKPQIMFYLAPFGSKVQQTRYVNISEIYG